ncbi:hypothetical protein [Flavobacterium sp.]|uniref:hypothetical protein n=1 Tax=Flavobacterium sp. TaxID=239 RepID=UPI002489D29B|nr:hypothetical protein [Flavobacterium sp.]MDI1316902.1 hypothetical protein [Flavobacterium sp.]
MFNELEKVIDYSLENDNYIEALENNVTGKKSADGIKQTARFLSRIYHFNKTKASFKILKYFWQHIENDDKKIIVFLYALNTDYLLSESINVVNETRIGDIASVENFEKNVELYYPNKFSKVTRHSIGKNLASSWKQIGMITGKTKNIRTQPIVNYNMVAFAFIMAYLEGLRGDFIVTSKWIKALCLNESQLRELAIEASKRGLIQYQFSGNVTSITCNEILKKLEINDI